MSFILTFINQLNIYWLKVILVMRVFAILVCLKVERLLGYETDMRRLYGKLKEKLLTFQSLGGSIFFQFIQGRKEPFCWKSMNCIEKR